MTQVAVVGAGGFVGAHVVGSLQGRGVDVRTVHAPRLRTSARTLPHLRQNVDGLTVSALRAELKDCGAVVNAAGLAIPTATDADALYGANALVPLLIAQAVPFGSRLVHLSSAAVQGWAGRLDESAAVRPFSSYSASKALGEAAIRGGYCDPVSLRATSVHGPNRPMTQTLFRLLSSRWSVVAGDGSRPTPQALASNVGAAAAELALCGSTPPATVLQPSEGLTCRSLSLLLTGREPNRIPVALAAGLVRTARIGGHVIPPSRIAARRAQMMLFGQAQSVSWLTRQGWQVPYGHDSWIELGTELRQKTPGIPGRGSVE